MLFIGGGGERKGRKDGGKEGGSFKLIHWFYMLFTIVAGEVEERDRKRGERGKGGGRAGRKAGGRAGGRKREPVGLKRLIIRTDATWCGSGKIRSNFKRHGFL